MNTPSAVACHDLSKRYDDGDRRIDAGVSGVGATPVLGVVVCRCGTGRGLGRGCPLRDQGRQRRRRSQV